MHALDRPVWASLATTQSTLSEGGGLARRYLRDVNLFASARDDSAAALEALSALVLPGEQVYILQVPAIAVPAGLQAVKTAKGVQMVSTRPLPAEPDEEIVHLTDADASEMLALAARTEPGPFVRRTHCLGRFLGIRRQGRLAAMAGERMRFPGSTEISGVCTDPDFRGLGLARRLSAAVGAAIQARGDLAFLHAWATNAPAISLYKSLGFEVRAEVQVAVLETHASLQGR